MVILSLKINFTPTGIRMVSCIDSNESSDQIKCTLSGIGIPFVPKEWYTVEDILNEYTEEKLGIGLVLKKEYLYLYEQCSMLKIPEEVDGEHVVRIRLEDEYAPYSVSNLGFTKLKWMKCSQESLRSFCGFPPQ